MILALANPIESAFANPCELETCKLNLLHPHPGSCPVAELVILYVFTLFVITILEPIVSAGFLSFVCPKCFTIHVCQPTYEEIQLLSCFKSIRSCVIYLT